MLLPLLQLQMAAATPPPPPLVFAHSWRTLPVFWFSANETGPETAAEQALIANYSVAVLSWELQTKGADPWRRTDTKMRALSAGACPHPDDTRKSQTYCFKNSSRNLLKQVATLF